MYIFYVIIFLSNYFFYKKILCCFVLTHFFFLSNIKYNYFCIVQDYIYTLGYSIVITNTQSAIKMIGSVTSRGSCLISQSCRQYLWQNLLSRASSQFASMLSLMLLNFNRMREERLDNSYHCSPTIVMPERSSTSSSHP